MTRNTGNNRHTIIVNVPPQQNETDVTANKIAREANKASWASVKVNGVLLFITFILAFISTCQYISSQNAAQIAQNTLDTTRKYNDSSLRIQKRALDSQFAAKKQSDMADAQKLKRDTEFVNKQKLGIDAQIASLKENQKEFELINRPFLEINNIKLDSPIVGENPRVNFNIKNFGKVPTKLLFINAQLIYKTKKDYKPLEVFKYARNNAGNYISEGAYVPFYAGDQANIYDKEIIQSIKDGKFFIYLIGNIAYINPMNNKIAEKSFDFYFTYSEYTKPNFGVNIVY